MRTTIDLPETLIRELKVLAAQRGTTLEQVIRAAIEFGIQDVQNIPVTRVRFPILGSREPGNLNLTNADIEDLLTRD